MHSRLLGVTFCLSVCQSVRLSVCPWLDRNYWTIIHIRRSKVSVVKVKCHMGQGQRSYWQTKAGGLTSMSSCFICDTDQINRYCALQKDDYVSSIDENYFLLCLYRISYLIFSESLISFSSAKSPVSTFLWYCAFTIMQVGFPIKWRLPRGLCSNCAHELAITNEEYAAKKPLLRSLSLSYRFLTVRILFDSIYCIYVVDPFYILCI